MSSPPWPGGGRPGSSPTATCIRNQFPGAIYLFYILGRVAGWGGSASIYAFDAGAVIVLGLALTVWSKRLAGTILPGLIGYLCFLSYYLTLDYSLAAQRDWHAPFFAVLSLLILQTWPGRIAAPATSAVSMAIALLIRPHAVLFLPAVALQFAGEMRVGSGVRRPAVWTSSFLVATLLGFAPLVVSGILPDFLAGVAHNNSSSQGAGAARRSHPLRSLQPARYVRHHRRADRHRLARQVGPQAQPGGRRLGDGVPGGPLIQTDPSAESCLSQDTARGGLCGERRGIDPVAAGRASGPGDFPAPLGLAPARRQLQDEAGILHDPTEPAGGVGVDTGRRRGHGTYSSGLSSRHGRDIRVLRVVGLPGDAGLLATPPIEGHQDRQRPQGRSRRGRAAGPSLRVSDRGHCLALDGQSGS